MPDTQAVLFDIDGTLISTGGASDRAWKRAFKELQDVDVDVPAVTGKGSGTGSCRRWPPPWQIHRSPAR